MLMSGNWNRRILSAAAVGVMLATSGCAATHGAVKKGASFSKYQTVYLLNFEEDPRHVLPKARKRLEELGFHVMLTAPDSPVFGNQGTGFLISREGHVLTAAHVLGDKTEATVWLNGNRYEADLVYQEGSQPDAPKKGKQPTSNENVSDAISAALNSSDNRSVAEALKEPDLAVLKIRTPDRSFVPASFAASPQYQMGQDVYTIGFPLSHILGEQPRLNKGLLSATVGMKDHPDFVQISAEIQPGNSGGPLLNEHGQVIGLVQMTLNPVKVLTQTGATPQNVNFAVKNTRIREFLQRGGEEMAGLKLREGDAMPFDDAQRSLLLVHAGIVPENFKQTSKLVCEVSYVYLWDLWFRFQTLDVVFYDFDTQEVLLRVGQYGDKPFSTEDTTLDQVFKDIQAKIGR